MSTSKKPRKAELLEIFRMVSAGDNQAEIEFEVELCIFKEFTVAVDRSRKNKIVFTSLLAVIDEKIARSLGVVEGEEYVS